jgi:hypothetical protein
MKRAKMIRKEMRDKGIKPAPYVFGLKPNTLQGFKELSRDLLEWCLRIDSLNINMFAISRMYLPRAIKQWAIENELLGKSYEFAKAVIACRLEQRAFDDTINVQMVKLRLPLLDDDLREFIEKNKEGIKTSGGVVYIQQPLIESSPLVPELDKKEEK